MNLKTTVLFCNTCSSSQLAAAQNFWACLFQPRKLQ